MENATRLLEEIREDMREVRRLLSEMAHQRKATTDKLIAAIRREEEEPMGVGA